MRRQNQITKARGSKAFLFNIAQSVIITKRLAHLLSIDQQKLTMNKIIYKLFARLAFRLCNLVLVMREHEVYSTNMNIQSFAKLFLAHYGTFNVPSRPSPTPRAHHTNFIFVHCFP